LVKQLVWEKSKTEKLLKMILARHQSKA